MKSSMLSEEIRFSRLVFTRFSMPEYVCTTYQSPGLDAQRLAELLERVRGGRVDRRDVCIVSGDRRRRRSPRRRVPRRQAPGLRRASSTAVSSVAVSSTASASIGDLVDSTGSGCLGGVSAARRRPSGRPGSTSDVASTDASVDARLVHDARSRPRRPGRGILLVRHRLALSRLGSFTSVVGCGVRRGCRGVDADVVRQPKIAKAALLNAKSSTHTNAIMNMTNTKHDHEVGDQLVARRPDDLAQLGDHLTEEQRRGWCDRRRWADARSTSSWRGFPSRRCLPHDVRSCFAGQEGLEPPTAGFGDRCSAN